MADEAPGYKPVRRVVTGHDSKNVAKVLMDGPAGNVKFPGPGTASATIWCTDATLADIAVGESIEDFGARSHDPATRQWLFRRRRLPARQRTLHAPYRNDRLCGRYGGRDRHGHGRFDGEAQSRRRHGPARTSKRWVNRGQRDRARRVCPGRCQAAWHWQADTGPQPRNADRPRNSAHVEHARRPPPQDQLFDHCKQAVQQKSHQTHHNQQPVNVGGAELALGDDDQAADARQAGQHFHQ